MTFQDLAGEQTGMTAEEFARMMASGGRPSTGAGTAGRRGEAADGPDRRRRRLFARARRGVAIDKGRTGDPYWAPYFAKVEPARRWMAEVAPDVCIVVYNDHASAFSLEVIPTFALGLADEFPPADEGYGPARCRSSGPPRPGLAPGRVADPRRVRHDPRQRDAGRPRAHRAAVGDVRRARGVAVPR